MYYLTKDNKIVNGSKISCQILNGNELNIQYFNDYDDLVEEVPGGIVIAKSENILDLGTDVDIVLRECHDELESVMLSWWNHWKMKIIDWTPNVLLKKQSNGDFKRYEVKTCL